MHNDTTPRVRGKPWPCEGPRMPGRYNPACAGKTRRTRRYSGKRQIQPRVCGENARSRLPSATRRDTTPRVRGKRGIRARHVSPFRYNPACAGKPEGTLGVGRRVRYNPACAGKTSSARLASVRTTIQPRVCGENASERSTVIVSVDTTPRVRGKQ